MNKLQEIEKQLSELDLESLDLSQFSMEEMLKKMDMTEKDLQMFQQSVEQAFTPADREAIVKAGKVIISSSQKAESIVKHKLKIPQGSDMTDAQSEILSHLISEKANELQRSALDL